MKCRRIILRHKSEGRGAALSAEGQVIRFGEFSADLETGELYRNGSKIKLQDQPFEILAILLQRPGKIVTREELRQKLWPSDTFVDFEHGLNAAVNKLRGALGDSAENPIWIETLPRRGYRFIGQIEVQKPADSGPDCPPPGLTNSSLQWPKPVFWAVLAGIALTVFAFLGYKWSKISTPAAPRTLTRLTFDDGLQIGATWSPDGRLVAYSSNRGGKFDIWVQQVNGGNPIQLTKGPGQNWQPDWAPDGRYIVYRSEGGDGGLFIVPALGGAGLERKVSSFGYYPRWSPDSTRILFQSMDLGGMDANSFFIVGLDGTTPREILKELGSVGVSAAWHPDGKRISAWVHHGDDRLASIPTFLTVPVEGGIPVRTEMRPEVGADAANAPDWPDWGEIRQDFKFCWHPSGRAIYFERTFEGARNLWRMTIDPATLRATGLERLTTGPGTDSQLSLSNDGKKLAFTGAREQIRTWLFPFDATTARVTGPGQPITTAGIESLAPNLSPDGHKLAFSTVRTNFGEHWTKNVSDNDQILVATDGIYARTFPVWSHDSARLAYSRQDLATHRTQLVEWSAADRTEHAVTGTSTDLFRRVCDWSSDGKALLVQRVSGENALSELWEVSLAERPEESIERPIAISKTEEIYQCRLSPDGHWIVFEAVRNSAEGSESALYALPRTGGTWIRLTDGKYWDDKPRWSPDGRTIYFMSGHGGFYGLWALHFDPSRGRGVGAPFLVKAFDDPSFIIPRNTVIVEISVSQNSLVVPLQQVSGGIWMLNNVDQ